MSNPVTQPYSALSPLRLDQSETTVVVLTAGGTLGQIVVNGLVAHLGRPVTVIEEPPEKKSAIIRRRIRLNGFFAALGQAVLGFALRALARRQKPRLNEIVQKNNFSLMANPDVTVHKVPSVNSEACRKLLASLKPDVVAVYGTRIIAKQTLGCVKAPFINYHAGTNPKYRGQHPAYWARASRDEENAGVTIHLVDEGVDTGEVLYQAPVSYDDNDTIMTYQYVQAGIAIPLFARSIRDALTKGLMTRQVSLPSKKWFPPTVWRYLYIGVTRGVW